MTVTSTPVPCPLCGVDWRRTELIGAAARGGGYRVRCHSCGHEWDDPTASHGERESLRRADRAIDLDGVDVSEVEAADREALLSGWHGEHDDVDPVRALALRLAVDSHGPAAGKDSDDCFPARAKRFESYLRSGE